MSDKPIEDMTRKELAIELITARTELEWLRSDLDSYKQAVNILREELGLGAIP